MNSLRLITRSLTYYWRTHLGVLLGAAAGAAVLVGALAVGDCVQYSLKALALRRLGNVTLALASSDRFFRAEGQSGAAPSDGDLATALEPLLGTMPAPVLMLDGSAATPDGAARANLVQVIGVDARFWQAGGAGNPLAAATNDDQAVINTHLARQLGVSVGQPIVLRVPKPSGLPRDAPLGSDRDAVASISATVRAVIDDDHFGRFSLRANQLAPLTAFVPLAGLQEKVGLAGRANALLVARAGAGGRPVVAQADWLLGRYWQLADAGLSLRDLPGGVLELRTSRVFLDPPVARAAVAAAAAAPGRRPLRVLTYFVNEASLAGKAAPYCIVAAMDAGDPTASPVPAGMPDSEIILNDWLAEDLAAKVGDFVELAFQVPGPMRTFQDRTRTFRVRAIIPIAGPAADRDLMPDFPGLAGVKNCRDWKPGMPIDLKKIRKKDEDYWTAHGGTPKAFVTLAAGQQMWGNRFGDLTAVRYVGPAAGSTSASAPANTATTPATAPATAPAGPRDEIARAILARLDPAEIGLFFQPVRQQALAAANPTSDFGGLFLGLSFFLIIAAVLLTGLLFVFNVEQRSRQTGTLLAVGFRPWRVRRMLLGEGAVLSLGGCVLGAAAGLAYAWVVLLGLRTVWSGATASAPILYHVETATVLTGAAIGFAVAMAAMLITLMIQGRATARELLAAGAEGRASRPAGRGKLIVGACVGVACIGGAVAMVVMAMRKEFADVAGAFFGSGGLLLIGSLSLAYVMLGALGRGAKCENASGGQACGGTMGLARLGLRTCGRRRWRSLTTAGLLACGVFLVASVEVFRLDPTRGADQRTSGTGGFALYGESAVPVLNDLNDPAWRAKRGLGDANLPGLNVVQMRLHEGDDASCLNLNRAQTPRLLGVDPRLLTGRFAFQQTIREAKDGWSLLDRPTGGGVLPLLGKTGTGTGAASSVPRRSQSPDDAPIPAIGDEGTLRWALQKAVGDTMEVTDERGRKVKLLFVGQLAGSVLQGSLVISEARLGRLYPSTSGYRVFLVDASPRRTDAVSRRLTAAMEDLGLALTPTVRRLAMFGEVQNTYLSIFAALGGLGLLLGSVGLGIVVLRNVLERRGELALLRAVGFSRGQLRSLVLYEHWALLALGLLCGTASAVIAVLPALQSPTADLPYASWLTILAGVTISGVAWTWLAATAALRGDLLAALRTE